MTKIWFAMMISIATLAACVMEPEEGDQEPAIEEVEQALAEDGRSYQQEPATLELKDPDDPLAQSCYTTTCTVGRPGNQLCTQLCGDVAKCTPAGMAGCGLRPCCVLQ